MLIMNVTFRCDENVVGMLLLRGNRIKHYRLHCEMTSCNLCRGFNYTNSLSGGGMILLTQNSKYTPEAA